jgi:phage terminase large subunit-like protein
MLSNTAVPKYYGEFRDAVRRGLYPVNEKISLEMNRIDQLIANPRYYYDPKPLEGWVRFQEGEMVLTDGSPQYVLDSFKLWAEQALCWFYFEERSVYEPNEDGHGGHYVTKVIKRRLTKIQYLIVGRGAAKSVYLTDHHAYGLTMDTTTTKQITVAPTMKQAEEVTSLLTTAITISRGALFKLLTRGSIQNTTGNKMNRPKLASTKKGIENLLTNSILEIKPLSIDKLQGLRVKYSTLDEWLSGEIRENPVNAIEQGASKIDDYLIICASSEGTVRNGIGDDIKMELDDILKGEYAADHISIWWYRLDTIDEVKNPDLWKKANPNLGITVQYDAYQRDVEKAEKVPSARNDILAKRFGIPMEGTTYFFPYHETLPHKKRNYWGMPCAMGADLSQGDDFCAFTFLFPLKDGKFGIKTRSYITSNTLVKLSSSMREKYENDFMAEGTLIVLEGIVLNMEEVYDDLDKFIMDSDYDVRCFGYDPYNADVFVSNWIRDNGEYGVGKVIQGRRTESVPLGELKKLSEERMLLFDESLMQFAMGNCIVLEDVNGNRMLYKKRSDQKIDNVAAMMDAYVAYKENMDLFD